MSLVLPQWFSVNGAGDLISTVDSGVVDWAKAQRLPLMPLLINEKFLPEVAHAVLSDAQIQSRLIEQILEALAVRRLYGLQLDLENFSPDDRDGYTQFATRLARALHRRRMKLSVAVPAPIGRPPSNPTPTTPRWAPSRHSLAFDYKGLGKVADFITLMAYDEYASAEDPGPIAGLPWVEACLRQALEAVPRNKLLLGMPLYYRQWSGKSVTEGPVAEALSLATEWKAKVELDREQSEQTFKFDDGGTLHVVWLHGAASLEEGMSLVKKYGLAGFSAWRLGQEDPAAWQSAFPAVRKKRP